jgi:hypothetical protein
MYQSFITCVAKLRQVSGNAQKNPIFTSNNQEMKNVIVVSETDAKL